MRSWIGGLVLLAGAAAAQEYVPAPHHIGRRIEQHVQQMIAEGYALHVTEMHQWGKNAPFVEDLSHGHAAFAAERAGTLEEAFTSVRFILYHTDEFTRRWNASTRPPTTRMQRSIVGHEDGAITPAIDMSSQVTGTDDYVRYGTVHLKSLDPAAPKTLLIQELGCELSNQFTLLPEPDGMYDSGKERFSIYFRCDAVLDPAVPQQSILYRGNSARQ